MKHEQYGFLPEEMFHSCLQQLYERYMSREYTPTEDMEQSYQQLEAAIGVGRFLGAECCDIRSQCAVRRI